MPGVGPARAYASIMDQRRGSLTTGLGGDGFGFGWRHNRVRAGVVLGILLRSVWTTTCVRAVWRRGLTPRRRFATILVT